MTYHNPGLDIILGPMYSNKTTELLKRLFTVTEVGMRALYINNALDVRNAKDVFSSHNPQLKDVLSNDLVEMISVKCLSLVDEKDIETADIIGIDEAHFFSSLTEILKWVEVKKKRVVIAGLDGDFNRQKFGHIFDLIPYCDSVVKLTAYCVICAEQKHLVSALFTYKTSKDTEIVSVGAHDKYKSLCRKCYLKLNTV